MDDTASSNTAPAGAAGEQAASEKKRASTTKMPAGLKVVVAVDASEESLHALAWALDNVVRPHPDAALVVVHAQHDAYDLAYPLAAHGIRMGYVPPTVVESMRKAQEEDSRRVVARALAICKEKQVDATAAVVQGDAKEAICQAAEQMQAGLLVLGSRGLGRIKRAFLGSVSDYLVHQASCPVLVVKPPKAHAN